MKKWKLFRRADGLVAKGDEIRAKIAEMQADVAARVAEIDAATAAMRAQMVARIAAQSNIEARNEERWAESLARQGITEEDVPLNEWPHVGFNPQPQPFKPNACGNPWCPVCGPPAVYTSGQWAQGFTPPPTFQAGQTITAAQFNSWVSGVGAPMLPGVGGGWSIGDPQQEDDLPGPTNEGDD